MTRLCCSLRFWSLAIVAIAVFVNVALPPLMSALLKHMFTAPDQVPWPHGSLRLINCSGIPAQTLYSTERIGELNNLEVFQQRPEDDVWVVSYVKSGTTWTIGILAALWDHPAAVHAGNIQKMTRTFCPQPELPDLGYGDDGFGHSVSELNDWQLFSSSSAAQAPCVTSRTTRVRYVTGLVCLGIRRTSNKPLCNCRHGLSLIPAHSTVRVCLIGTPVSTVPGHLFLKVP